MPRVLLVCYRFPPAGGPGVQRNLKYTKYFPSLGWTPVVLTPKPVSYYVYDEALLDEIPDEAHVVRTGSADPARLGYLALRALGRDPLAAKPESSDLVNSPGTVSSISKTEKKSGFLSDTSWAIRTYRQIRDWVLFPDGVSAWIPFAVLRGLRELRRRPVDAIIGAYGPASSVLVAMTLARLTNTPLVLDFRDGWVDYPHRSDPTSAHLTAQRWLEAKALRAADHVVVYGPYLSERMLARYPDLEGKFSHIPNGFDRSDFQDVDPIRAEDGRFRIVHVGNLLSYRSEAFMTFLDAVKTLPDEVLDRIEILFVGNAYPDAEREVLARGLGHVVTLHGYEPHARAVQYLMGADAGLIMLTPGDFAAVTGKVFEYLAAELPILSVCEPEGALADLIKPLGHLVVDFGDTDGITSALHRLADGDTLDVDTRVEHLSREANTKKMASVLERVAR